MTQKRLPPRLMGCLAPLLVEGPATALSLSSESLELEAARFAFFEGGGLSCEGEGPDAADLSAGWASLGKSEPDVERSTPFSFTGAGADAIGGIVGIVGFISLGCSSSEFSVAESLSGFVLDGPAWGKANDWSFNLVPANSSQSST